jgi:alpha-tubulin suppressor-like RCC1 family protein
LIARTPDGSFSNLTIYNTTACAIRDDDVGICWGNTNSTLLDVVDYGIGLYHTCAVKRDGQLTCSVAYGYEEYGLGVPPDGRYTEVASGSYHACALATDGTVECWGRNYYGEASPP